MSSNTVKQASEALYTIVRQPWTRGKVGIFSRRYELFCHAVPLGFIFVLLADVLYLKVLSGGPLQQTLNRFITSLFFFNSLHIYFTFASLLTVPEMRKWVSETTDGKPAKFWIEIAGVMLVASIFTAIAYFGIPINRTTLPIIGIVVLGIIPYHHTIMQVFGLSMLYNARIAKSQNFTEEEKRQAKSCSIRERWGFRLFMFFAFSFLLAVLAQNALNSSSLSVIRRSLHVFSSLSVVFIILNSLTFPHAARSNKTIFLSRLLYYPILPFSICADAALRACHGTEYLCVTETMARNSSMSATVRRHFMVVIVLFTILGVLFLLCRNADGLVGFWYGGYDKVPWLIKVFAFVSIVLTYTHYYLDRRIFRFRNASNREHVLPLLSGSDQ